MIFPLDDGDIYVMSEKAVGTDWKKKVIYTLRHSTGCAKFTTILESKPKSSTVANNGASKGKTSKKDTKLLIPKLEKQKSSSSLGSSSS
jgi:hypothetical protein